jgi:hypothetical protein
MRFTKKDTTWCFPGSGCHLQYVGVQPLRIEITENNIDFVEGFINKLGEYEDIDEEPKRLEKIKIAFEIIVRKKIDVSILLDYISRDKELRFGALKTYNLLENKAIQLTHEEFDLLKEVLK